MPGYQFCNMAGRLPLIPGISADASRHRKTTGGWQWHSRHKSSWSFRSLAGISVILGLVLLVAGGALLMGLYGYLPWPFATASTCHDCVVMPNWRQHPDSLPCGQCTGHYCIKIDTMLGTTLSTQKTCGFGAMQLEDTCETREWESGIFQHHCYCTGDLCNSGQIMKVHFTLALVVMLGMILWI